LLRHVMGSLDAGGCLGKHRLTARGPVSQVQKRVSFTGAWRDAHAVREGSKSFARQLQLVLHRKFPE